MIKSPQHNKQQPIIIIQDITHGNISTTTDDILNQLALFRYSSHLKGVNLNQFMQMTDEKDFMQYGIRKQRDCHRLSLCAQSIRRTSLCSSSDELFFEQGEYPNSPIMSPSNPALDDDDVSQLSLSSPILTTESNSNSSSSVLLSLRNDDDCKDEIPQQQYQQEWPNSKIINQDEDLKPPKYVEDHRRYSLPSLKPPEYCDSILDKKRRYSYTEGTVYKDPNEGKEQLPKYSCTVQKMGKAQAKVEFESPGIRRLRRPWRDVYLELQGTVLKIYEIKSITPTTGGGYRYLPMLTAYYQQPVKYISLYNISLANIKVEVAMDYVKRPNIFRIITKDGPQLLIQVQTNAAVSAWMEKLASGCNIAVDLEHQRMPKFDSVQLVEPFAGWNSSTRLLYQEYVTEELQRRDTDSIDALI